ncbi:MAG: ComEA family DNA-binding protein [Thiohalomonadales bacterium]
MNKLIIKFLIIFAFCLQNVNAETVDINSADALTISKNLKGIGLKKATRIVEFRVLNGPFRSVDDITKVKGIGPKTLERNKEDIIVSK